MSKTLIAIITTSVIAIGVSATFLFPIVKNINSAVSSDEIAEQKLENLPTNNPLDVNSSSSTTSNTSNSKDNPEVNIDNQNVFGKRREHDYLKSDTIDSKYLIDDVK